MDEGELQTGPCVQALQAYVQPMYTECLSYANHFYRDYLFNLVLFYLLLQFLCELYANPTFIWQKTLYLGQLTLSPHP